MIQSKTKRRRLKFALLTFLIVALAIWRFASLWNSLKQDIVIHPQDDGYILSNNNRVAETVVSNFSDFESWKRAMLDRVDSSLLGRSIMMDLLSKEERDNYLAAIWREETSNADRKTPDLDPHQYGNNLGCAYQALALLYEVSGKKAKATELYMKAADNGEDTAAFFYLAALKCFDAGDLKNAMIYLNKALAEASSFELFPMEIEIGEYKLFKGYIHLMQRRYDEAEKMFQEASRYENTFGLIMEGTLNAVFAMVGGDAMATARRKFMTAFFSKSREHITIARLGALVGMGHLAIEKKDLSRAQKYLSAAWEDTEHYASIHGLEPASLFAHKLIFKLYCIGKAWIHANKNTHDKAIKYYRLALKSGSDDLIVLLGLGNSLIELNRLDEAERVLKHVFKLAPGNQNALVKLGTIRYKRGEDLQAEKAFKDALKMNASDTCPYEGLGLLYLRQGRTKDAKAFLKRSIELNRNIDYKKFNGLARILIKEGRFKQAEKLLKKSIVNYPYQHEAKRLLDVIYNVKRREEGKSSDDRGCRGYISRPP